MHKQEEDKIRKLNKLIIANKELVIQNEEKEKRVSELLITNKELLFQNKEKEKRAAELIFANEELKKTEDALKEKEYFLRESQIAGDIGSYKTNFVTGYWQSSETLDSIFGIDDNYDRTVPGWLAIVHPDERQKMEQYLRLEVLGKQKSFNKEYRIVRNNDKQTRWVHGLGNIKNDDSGNISELIGTIQDITERINVEELLSQSEMNLRTIFENTDTGLFLLDNKFNIIAFNKKIDQFAKLSFGFEIQEKQNLIKLITSEKQKQFADLFGDVIRSNNINNYEISYIQMDGSIIWYSISGNKVYDSNGNMSGICLAVNDITERKKSETAISESEETFRRLFSESADSILLLGDTGFTDCNQSAVSILGFSSRKEVLNKKPWDISPEKQPDGRLSTEKAEAMIAKALQQGYNRFEWVHAKSDGTAFPVEVMLTPIILKGKQLLYSVVRDITERKKAEEELLKSNERYEFVNKATHDTLWEWDYVRKEGLWGNGIIEIFGYSEDNLKYSENWLDEYIHPNDREQMRRSIQTCIESGTENWQGEYRFRCADGVYKNVYDRGFILFDDQGKPYRMFGAMTDVTETKRLERKLVEQQIKQQKLITETIIQTQEKDRNELGRELHDNINQILATVYMYLGMARSGQGIQEELIGKSHDYVKEVMEEIRTLSHTLVVPSLGDIGLKEALEELTMDTNFPNGLQIKIVVDENYNENGLDKNKKLMFYRIVQEQLSNIIKYAGANEVVVSFRTDNGKHFLSVADNGDGFDISQKSQGIGLNNISSRIEFYSGNMNIISTPGNGCTLEVTIPL